MLDLHFIRENAEAVQQNIYDRRMDVDVQEFLQLDAVYRTLLQEVEELRAERNTIANTLKTGPENKAEMIQRGKEVKTLLSEKESGLQDLKEKRDEIWMQIPNMTHPKAPQGADDADNRELRIVGTPTQFAFEPKDHVELGKLHDILDFERAAQVAGSGFYYKKNALALLEFGVIQFALGTAMKHGFTPMITPDVARHSILQGTGYNPRGNETQIYSLNNTDLGLVATAEIPVAGYYANHTFTAKEIAEPVRIVAVSHCFRTEDGAYGKESRGLYRVHQFAKAELFVLCRPEDAEAELNRLVQIEEELMQQLNIPYRVVDICTGDLGGPAYRKYDIEAWMPFKNDWGEVTSASNCTDYQARRLQIRFENEKGENAFVYTLNGTAAALSRLPIAILENNQQEDGSIQVPEVLHPYMHGITTIQA